MAITVARAFDFVDQDRPKGVCVVLLDRVWPRGLRKDELGLDEWARHLAPSSELRRWYNYEEERWDDFCRRYQDELEPFQAEMARMAELASTGNLVLLYGDRERELNQAEAFRRILRERYQLVA
jgi:uncharacterized protein YeaO (DUF488 family)